MSIEYATGACPQLQDDKGEINAVGGYQNQNNRYRQRNGQNQFGLQNNAFSWRDENNFQQNRANQSTSRQEQQPYRISHHRKSNQPTHHDSPQGTLLEETVRQLAQMVQQQGQTMQHNQGRTDQAIAEIQQTLSKVSKHRSQISAAVYPQQVTGGKLPSQTIPNPRSDINAVSLRNGRDLDAERNDAETASGAGEGQFTGADEEALGQPKSSLPAPITYSSPVPVVKHA